VTPSAYIALARDLIIVVALGLLIWLLMSFGADRVKVADIKAVQKQITDNAKTEADWRKKQTDANAQRDIDLAQVAAGIAAQHAPVIVRSGPARACPVSVPAAQAGGPPAAAGGADEGSGIDRDIRPQLNAFEFKAETAIADCRAALDGWPK
jgi:hypothetical protein